MKHLHSVIHLLGTVWFLVNGLLLPIGIFSTGYMFSHRIVVGNPLIIPAALSFIIWGIPNFIASYAIIRTRAWGWGLGFILSGFGLIAILAKARPNDLLRLLQQASGVSMSAIGYLLSRYRNTNQ
jgi:hypothetical protein